MHRLLFWIVIVPLGALVVLFAVANRAPVIVSLDPFSGDNSALAFSAPLFLVMIGCTILGLLIAWLASLSYRYRMWRAVRRAEEDAERHKAEADRERRAREALQPEALQPEFPPLAPPS